jgi:Cu+-exporting ATPase
MRALVMTAAVLVLVGGAYALQCGKCASCDKTGAAQMDFSAKLVMLNGDSLDLSQVTGIQPVMFFHLVLDTSHQHEFELVRDFWDVTQTDTPPRIVIYGVFSDTGVKALKAARKLAVPYPVLLDPGCQTLGLCGQERCEPRVVFLDAGGQVVQNSSEITEDVLKQGLVAATTVAEVGDPVCGMKVNPQTAAASMEYKGNTYYFCSQACHERFMKNPAKYSQ